MADEQDFGKLLRQRQTLKEYPSSGVYSDQYDLYGIAPKSGQAGGNIGAVSPTVLEVVDCPLLGFNDSGVHSLYLAVKKAVQSQLWNGAQIKLSADGGATYAPVSNPSSQSLMGYTTNALAAGPVESYDLINTVTVGMDFNSSIGSTNEPLWLDEALLAVIGGPGRWEVISFQTVTQLGSNTFRLSKLLRGLHGTEEAVGQHIIGDRFYLASTLYKIIRPNSEVGTNYQFKPISIGEDETLISPQSFLSYGESLKPYSPCHFTFVRDKVSQDWTVSFDARARTKSNKNYWYSVALSDTPESYEIEVLDDHDGNVLNIYPIGALPWVYSAAEQVNDYGAEAQVIYLRVFQINAVYGRGSPALVTLDDTI